MPVDYVLEYKTVVGRELDYVFEFFSSAANLQRITPPELHFKIRSSLPIEMKNGAVIEYTIRLFGIPMSWRTVITDWNPPLSFEDTQTTGPYRKWVHTHSFERNGDTTVIKDRVVYSLPFGLLGRLAHPLVKRQLKRIFAFRTSKIAEIFSQRD